MVTSDFRMNSRRNVAYGLLLAAVAMMALLFLNAGSAYAQSSSSTSGGTGSSSGGSAGTGTGNATATGNSSASDPTTVSGTGGTITIASQTGTVKNKGTATAISGDNTTVGNDSRNLAVNGQNNPGGSGVNANQGSTSNNSSGSSSTTTGNATATGNSSSTSLNQNVNANSTGQLGGILIVTQDANIDNVGRASAISGNNTGIGNNSRNAAVNGQDLGRRPGAINNNSAAVSNGSGGNSLIDTGDSTATGNSASTSVSQVVNGSVGGSLGGIAVVDQHATVNNRGIATARSGGNVGIGNNSANLTVNSQRLGARGPPSIRTNDAPVSNSSEGNASVITGNSTATGNSSSTNITQQVNVTTTGSGFVLSNQRANIINRGTASAISGDNRVTGNNSRNLAVNCQLINANSCFGGRARPTGGGALPRGVNNVVANFGAATNNSGGSASADTGNSTATGNTSNDTVAQTTTANFGGSGFVLATPVANVINRGNARAVSGGNTVTGNASRNLPINCQVISSAPCFGRGRGAAATGQRTRTSVPANFGQATNTSNGSASVVTGNSTASGNNSATTVAQGVSSNIGGSGFVIFNPVANVINTGVGFAGSGGNAAVGNSSRNLTVNCQELFTAPCVGSGRGGRGVGAAGTNVRSNFGQATNNSNGSARIVTGDSEAWGSTSTTSVAQALNSNIAGSGFVIYDPVTFVRNRGVARAVSGANLAVGNGSRNLAINCQVQSSGPCFLRGRRGAAGGAGRGGFRVVNANFGAATNNSNGDASIETGGSHALGNTATTSISQTLNLGIPGFGGLAFFDPRATLINRGVANAISGNNLATGNASANLGINCQMIGVSSCTLRTRGNARINNLSTNDGTATNNSWGSASVKTGCSCAVGNRTATAIKQGGSVNLGTFGSLFFDPNARLINTGDATATSGGNVTTGNDSANLALNRQRLGAPGGVAFNNGTATNTSTGTAHTETGDATAIGNMAATAICQGINGPLDCPVPPLPPLPDCFNKEAKPGAPGAPVTPGEALPRTGAPLNVLALLGVTLIALGALLRKKGQVTA
jgi:LPXTG-motif cell wall-anchored protein